ncbi:energy-coupling factor transporter transmembrane protein EcfT [Propioniciclava coleopterorum]|uniref:Energy-coupling factor transporter transmembrane protein EcfT n=1 Tax=Propioniciclava coleopterorum TaxID=2714937 RepID=A0A6G7Y805_9ACTN|nr:energy-coupling factor transporter transmembrane component T [Propioniciclava coleopterorum]QIK72761.1 energy-coupling factor transporter transmembrane protein EcfT [Propioniciclava coleopterorum]
MSTPQPPAAAHHGAPAAWLARREPTVKVGVLLGVSLITLVMFDPAPLAGWYLLALVGVLATARMPARTLLLGQAPFVLFAVGLVSVNALSRPGTEIWPGAPIRVTYEGLSIGIALALRGLLIGVLTLGFLATTPPRDLMVSLLLRVRLSPRYAYAILAGHRMLGAMPARWATIRAAHAVRAPLGRDGRPRLGARGWGRCAFALLTTSVRSAERIALALESRGLADGPRTVWRPVPLGAGDLVLVGVVAAAIIAGLASQGILPPAFLG